ncbi:MAG: hypothetical protein J0L63_04325 [Anaerolineae bacterium]|nr:hypothetical protein [Anaerolineae bacterium]MBN8618106.1 hypothetical protein [Anaerolineae bacterium]
MGIRLDCPECNERMTFDLANTRVYCKHCGYTPSTGLDERAEEIRAKGPRPNISIVNEGRIQPRAASLFYTAHDRLWENDQTGAIQALHSAVEIQPDFADAHIWLAKLADDEKVKRDHLGTILAYDPSHVEATRMMLVLNGRFTEAQLSQIDKSDGPRSQYAEGPVATTTRTLRCPNCKGDLTTSEQSGRVHCAFCGYSGPIPERQHNGAEMLLTAMLERRAQPIKWIIGERLLYCKECGAERTLSANQLSTRCLFCGSNHVIEQDALGSFEQPDGIIPFKISREEAGERIKGELRKVTERVKGWFDNNKIASASLSGIYLPFWMFDATAQVTRTRIQNEPSNSRYGYLRSMAATPIQTQSQYTEMFADIEVCAVDSPAAEMTRQLGDYHTREMVQYDPSLLARYPAELYTKDFDQAALDARSYISAAMRYKYGRREGMEDEKVTINVFSTVQQMSFQLVLVPVWIAHLVEEDRDRRSALVNGQTGLVVLGKTEKWRRR